MEMYCIGNIRKSEVAQEIVVLTGKHVGIKTEYREAANIPEGSDLSDEDTNTYFSKMGSVWIDPKYDETQLGAFWEEFDRLQGLITRPLNEPILPDDYPIHQGYFYVANGKVREFIDGMNMTAGRWKNLRIEGVEPITEVRRCDIAGRQARLPLKKEPETTMQRGWNQKGNHMHQRRRKPRNSNKIKKVMRNV